MQRLRNLAALVAAMGFVVVAHAQDVQGHDEPSLGDVARQSRQQRQQTAKRVITNDEIPEHPSPARPPALYQQNPYASYQQPTYTMPANYVKQQILGQKRAIARQEAEIERVNSSIQYAGGSCAVGCGQWNERQREKQEQVERMKQMLDQMKANLETVQEMARRQGYGSSVYDP